MSLAPFYRGDTVPFTFAFTDTSVTPAVPVSIVGKKLTLTLKAAKSDPDPGALQKVLGPFPNDTESQNGTGAFELTSTETDTLTPGKFYYDFQLHDTSTSPPRVTTLGAGTVSVLEDITRSHA